MVPFLVVLLYPVLYFSELFGIVLTLPFEFYCCCGLVLFISWYLSLVSRSVVVL